MVVKKIWDDVEKALDDIENVASYYAGGTLCIDNVIGNGVHIGLNRDGKGFIFNCKAKNGELYLPPHITTKVNAIYNKYKKPKAS